MTIDVAEEPMTALAEYARLRSHIIHFLVERSRHLQEQALADARAEGNRAAGELIPTR